jgi:hypothetical protein
MEELERVRKYFVRCYLLYLVGCLLFGDRSNKRIELVYLTTMEDGYAGMRNYSWGGMTLAYLYNELVKACFPGDRQLGGSVTLLTVRKFKFKFYFFVNFNFFLLTIIFLLYFPCVIIYKCDLYGLCRHGFWRTFLSFMLLIQTPTMLRTYRLWRGGRFRRVMERGSRIGHCLIVLRLMTYVGGRTKGTGSSRLSRRYSGIQAGLCAVIVWCTVTFPRGY